MKKNDSRLHRSDDYNSGIKRARLQRYIRPETDYFWFPEAIDGTLEVGAAATIDFGKDYVFQILVVAADPYDYFAYRWVPANADGSLGFKGGVLSVPNTLVEFRLVDDPKGTALTLTESGFLTLPIAVAEKQLEQNSGGWD